MVGTSPKNHSSGTFNPVTSFRVCRPLSLIDRPALAPRWGGAAIGAVPVYDFALARPIGAASGSEYDRSRPEAAVSGETMRTKGQALFRALSVAARAFPINLLERAPRASCSRFRPLRLSENSVFLLDQGRPPSSRRPLYTL